MTDKAKIWRVSEILKFSVNYLQERGFDDARSAVEWMLTDALKCSRMKLYLDFERPLTENERALFRRYLLDCAQHRPVQHIIGKSEFYGISLISDASALIPRPETERLVELALEKIASRRTEALQILDIGTGSGAIAIALASHLPSAKIDALDISPKALELLQKNLRYHNLEKRINAIEADCFQFQPAKRYDLIISNPPYIAASEWQSLEPRVSYYEPRLALTDEGDGLTFYRHFAEKFPQWLKDDGIAFLEYGGAHQSNALKQLFGEWQTARIHKDYQHDDRVLELAAFNLRAN
ncbi:MAG TPA: peptide chain release factor N(5)-glutamine methyltransferase [Candidatus Marinimicrobia bacterium]|nr:peptide chain release factor N(5)-glutamine methyltransferase [Candidatus Neomarinimicrobiota bacterium]